MVGYELHDARYVGQMVCITGPSISLSARHRPSLFTMCTLEITPAGMRRDSGRAMMEHYTYERRVKGTFSPILLKRKILISKARRMRRRRLACPVTSCPSYRLVNLRGAELPSCKFTRRDCRKFALCGDSRGKPNPGAWIE